MYNQYVTKAHQDAPEDGKRDAHVHPQPRSEMRAPERLSLHANGVTQFQRTSQIRIGKGRKKDGAVGRPVAPLTS
jgi:hypothetical protein